MPRVRFGIFDFDPATGELRREGAGVRLQPQPAQVLAYLVAHAGEVVTRESLREAIWGGDTFVDFDRGLNFCIAQIRTALGDAAESPRFVRTLPKRGYQFIAPVQPLSAVSSAATEANDRAAAPQRPGTARAADSPALGPRIAIALLVVALTGVGFAAGRWWPRRASGKEAIVAVARFDNQTANPEFDRFADALTDAVVAQLTAAGQGQFQVIGNAPSLRRPREQRDLRAIGGALGAGYIVFGQVQLNGGRVRVLAHLIRLPEQTHLWVTRLDRSFADPLALQLEVAQIIAREFSSHLPSGASPPRSASPTGNN